MQGIREIGRSERIRTSDPLLPKQVRYQTALRPELCREDVEGDSLALLQQAFGICLQGSRVRLFEFIRDSPTAGLVIQARS